MPEEYVTLHLRPLQLFLNIFLRKFQKFAQFLQKNIIILGRLYYTGSID